MICTRPLTRKFNVARIFVVIWLSAVLLAAGCIMVLLSLYDGLVVQYPENFASRMDVEIVFIGSSLNRAALPAKVPRGGVLGDGRSAEILSIDGISERQSTRLLGEALDSGVETIFLEINAYAHEYVGMTESVVLAGLARRMSDLGADLTLSAKALFDVERQPGRTLHLGGIAKDRTLTAAQSTAEQYYRFRPLEPSFGDELRFQLTRARNANIEVIFFSPPRPQLAVNMIGQSEFADLHAHLERIAAVYGVPLWHSPEPWPDDHFMDILAHANERGRARFRRELAEWYGARQ